MPNATWFSQGRTLCINGGADPQVRAGRPRPAFRATASASCRFRQADVPRGYPVGRGPGGPPHHFRRIPIFQKLCGIRRFRLPTLRHPARIATRLPASPPPRVLSFSAAAHPVASLFSRRKLESDLAETEPICPLHTGDIAQHYRRHGVRCNNECYLPGKPLSDPIQRDRFFWRFLV